MVPVSPNVNRRTLIISYQDIKSVYVQSNTDQVFHTKKILRTSVQISLKTRLGWAITYVRAIELNQADLL